MTNREKIWWQARRWVSRWQGGRSKPTPEMAYLAGWQAAMRDIRKRSEAELPALLRRQAG